MELHLLQLDAVAVPTLVTGVANEDVNSKVAVAALRLSDSHKEVRLMPLLLPVKRKELQQIPSEVHPSLSQDLLQYNGHFS